MNFCLGDECTWTFEGGFFSGESCLISGLIFNTTNARRMRRAWTSRKARRQKSNELHVSKVYYCEPQKSFLRSLVLLLESRNRAMQFSGSSAVARKLYPVWYKSSGGKGCNELVTRLIIMGKVCSLPLSLREYENFRHFLGLNRF